MKQTQHYHITRGSYYRFQHRPIQKIQIAAAKLSIRIIKKYIGGNSQSTV